MDPLAILQAVPDWVLLGLAVAGTGAAGVSGAAWRVQRRRAQALERSLFTVTHATDTTVDPRSGLLARPEFDNAFNAAASRCRQRGGEICLMVVDLDDFGSVNDTLGHRAGDKVMREVSRRLAKAAPAGSAAMRMGGDEYVLMIGGDIEQAKRVAAALQELLAEPMALGDHRLQLTASVGIAAYPTHGSRARLLSCASAAMRSVKAVGGGDWAVYDPQSAVDHQLQDSLLADLRVAVEKRQLELFYQPKVEARSLQVTAAEALLRWHHPEQGMISPAVFVPLAERHGLIGAIGNWVIDEACRQAGVWRKAGLRMRVAINLSAYQMRQDDVAGRLQKALAANELEPGRFTVEITESLALENTRATQQTFEGLRRAGLHVAIDDFGAGQTSLAYLRQLPVSELKMDIGLVRDIATSGDARVIAEAVIRMAHALEMRVVAEGVENAAQRDLLVRLGADELQGFLFARPMSARALGMWALDPSNARRGGEQGGFRPSLYVTRQANVA
ncbi:MAG: bifunctional diguanylate cyclase/phosphodiesterase [Burkholderiales bacterium]|nr:bifunctional diguanylate cyclase/phosphodiesterase [Burkholderiales bacterium]